MKTMTCILLSLSLPVAVLAQTEWEQSYDIPSGQAVSMQFKYPELIKISTWDQNKVLVKATVRINLGRNDDAFKITDEIRNGTLYLTSSIENYDQLPQYTIVSLDDKEYLFTGGWNDPELQKFLDENDNKSVSWISNGVQKDIELDITVPHNIELDIYTRHGMIEFNSLPKSVVANSRHRGVDVSIAKTEQFDFELYTRHGEVFTNLDLDFEQPRSRFKKQKDTYITGKYNGGGQRMVFETRHGNIYLRAKN